MRADADAAQARTRTRTNKRGRGRGPTGADADADPTQRTRTRTPHRRGRGRATHTHKAHTHAHTHTAHTHTPTLSMHAQDTLSTHQNQPRFALEKGLHRRAPRTPRQFFFGCTLLCIQGEGACGKKPHTSAHRPRCVTRRSSGCEHCAMGIIYIRHIAVTYPHTGTSPQHAS